MAVTAAMVKELREMTGAGMMDCKKALAATDGDMDKAVEFLREKGLAGATKKAGRIAAEGIVMTKVTADEKKAVVVEVNAETDFVAKNEKFQNYVSDVAEQALNTSAVDIDAFLAEKWAKLPIVKAKIGPKVVTMIADEKVFLQLPLRTEAKVVISGLYITEIKSVRGGIPPLPKKKKFFDRFKKNTEEAAKKEASKSKKNK